MSRSSQGLIMFSPPRIVYSSSDLIPVFLTVQQSLKHTSIFLLHLERAVRTAKKSNVYYIFYFQHNKGFGRKDLKFNELAMFCICYFKLLQNHMVRKIVSILHVKLRKIK